jgi:hypothetical protein
MALEIGPHTPHLVFFINYLEK